MELLEAEQVGDKKEEDNDGSPSERQQRQVYFQEKSNKELKTTDWLLLPH